MPATPEEQRAHLEALRLDIRGEIKQRIEQRDRYSIQLTLAIGAIFGVALSRDDFVRILLAAPLVSLYFMSLIQYSYRIHSVLARYLRDVVEPALADHLGLERELEWELWYAMKAREIPGIRSGFFFVMHVIISLIACIVVLVYEFQQEDQESLYLFLDWTVLIATMLLSGVVATPRFWNLWRLGPAAGEQANA